MLINHFNKQYVAKICTVVFTGIHSIQNSVATMRIRKLIKDEIAASGKSFAHLQEQYPDRDSCQPCV